MTGWLKNVTGASAAQRNAEAQIAAAKKSAADQQTALISQARATADQQRQLAERAQVAAQVQRDQEAPTPGVDVQLDDSRTGLDAVKRRRANFLVGYSQ